MRTFALAALLALGCNREDDAVRADVQLLALSSGEQGQAVVERLAKEGRRALPPIEAALHTAEPPGRKNLIMALRKIGDPEAVPLLRHLAQYDAAEDVRREAKWTLRGWAAGSGARADAAKAALRQLDEAEGREEAG